MELDWWLIIPLLHLPKGFEGFQDGLDFLAAFGGGAGGEVLGEGCGVGGGGGEEGFDEDHAGGQCFGPDMQCGR